MQPKLQPDLVALLPVFGQQVQYRPGDAIRSCTHGKADYPRLCQRLVIQLFELVNAELATARERYNQLMDDPGYIETVLQQGAERAREHSTPLLQKVREAVGISAIC